MLPNDTNAAPPLGFGSTDELGDTAAAVDWETHRYTNAVLCELRPRAEYRGRQAKPQVLQRAGSRFMLAAQWRMGGKDPYPGEYALSTPDGARELFEALGVTWLASGDVVPVAPNV